MKVTFIMAAIIIAGVFASGHAFAQSNSCKDFSTELATTPATPSSLSGMALSKKLISQQPGEADLVLIGDSLFQNWGEKPSADIPNAKVWNFSVSGDKTQNVLWRLNQIQPGKQKPKAVVVFVGTNNLSDSGMDACGIYEGIKAIVSKAKEIWSAPVFVLSITPRGADFHQFDKERLPLNDMISNISSQIENSYPVQLNDNEITCGNYSKETLPPNTMACFPEQAYKCSNFRPDNLHFLPPAYKILASAISKQSVSALGLDILK